MKSSKIIALLSAAALAVAPNFALAREPTSKSAKSVAALNAASALKISPVQEFAFLKGGVYLVQTSPQRITDLALEQGEQLLSVSAGDTARWIVGDARSGMGRTLQVHVLVKPNAAGLSTNLLIMTDRRVYHVELRSLASFGMAAVSWRYPEDISLSAPPSTQLKPGASGLKYEAATIAGVPAEELNFKYRISGDKTAWRPLRAFDDGRRVFIQMPANVATTSAPPLFVIGDNGPELVNYRVRGQYYVVDKLFDRAELRLGDKHPKAVRIDRRVKLASNGGDNG